MTTIQAIIMGLIQGLTEYLPVSSSGHLAIASALTGVDGESSMTFTIAVHVATVLSTIVVLGRQIGQIIVGTFSPLGPGTGLQRLNPSQQYLLNIVISMVPIGIVGVFFKDQVEAIFGSGLTIVGICLLVTALLLTFSYLARPRQRQSISPLHAFIIGISQALAVLPVSAVRAPPLPPASCSATTRQPWPSSHSSWSYPPYWVKHCSTPSK